jgi:TonB family protein
VIVGPKALFSPSPIYPHKHKKVDGWVDLSGYVGTDGKFHNPKVLKSLDPTLDALAVEAVGRWKFQPATRAGVPFNCPLTMEINFKLPH